MNSMQKHYETELKKHQQAGDNQTAQLIRDLKERVAYLSGLSGIKPVVRRRLETGLRQLDILKSAMEKASDQFFQEKLNV